jgi:AcrR family transcriptional regulator
VPSKAPAKRGRVTTDSSDGANGEAPVARGTRTAEAINEAAIELFWRHGYEATTLLEIAA